MGGESLESVDERVCGREGEGNLTRGTWVGRENRLEACKERLSGKSGKDEDRVDMVVGVPRVSGVGYSFRDLCRSKGKKGTGCPSSLDS